SSTQVDITGQPVDGRIAVGSPPIEESPAPKPAAPANPSVNFKAGAEDPLVGVKIKEVFRRNRNFLRQGFRKRDLKSARRLIGQGLVVNHPRLVSLPVWSMNSS